MVAIVQMKLQSRLGYLIMKNWWWTKTQLPKKPFIRSVLELSYLFDWFSPYEFIVEAQYQFESHNSFWEHIQTLASFAIPTTPTQEFVVECDHWSDFSGYRRILWSGQKVINKKSAGSFHHALVGRPFKRKITIPNGDYQFYHWWVFRFHIENKFCYHKVNL